MSSSQQQNMNGGGKKSASSKHGKSHHQQQQDSNSKPANDSTELLLKNDYRVIMKNYDITKNKSRPIMTQYEKTLIIGERATQIAYGAETTIQVVPGMTEIDMAIEELRQRKCPFIIKRYIGDVVEYWRPEDLEIRF